MLPRELLGETRLLFHALKQWSEILHAPLGMTAAMRGVLELILLGGPATVPSMARARGVSRQHIQQQVDALRGRGFVERKENPAHKRSTMIALTDKGRAAHMQIKPELDARYRHLLAALDTNEQGALRDAIQKLAKATEKTDFTNLADVSEGA